MGGEEEGGMRRFVRSKVWQKGCWTGGDSAVTPGVEDMGTRFGVGAVGLNISNVTTDTLNHHPLQYITYIICYGYIQKRMKSRTRTS